MVLPRVSTPPLRNIRRRTGSSVWCTTEQQIELMEPGAGSGLCRLFQNPDIMALAQAAPASEPGGSLRDEIFFLLRTALKDRPKGPQTANRQLPSTANRHQPPTTNRHQPPATNRRQPPAATNRQLPTTANPLQPPTASHQLPPTTTNCHQPPVANCQPPTAANRQPPTATNHG